MKRAHPFLIATLLLPALFVIGVFILWPALRSVYLSFFEIDPFSQSSVFIGLDNFKELLFSVDYWQTVKVSLLFLLYTVIPSVVVSLWVAVFLDQNPYARGVFRTLFLMPVAISSAMAAMLWIFIFNPTVGYLNYILESLGLFTPNWLGDPAYALIAVSIVTIWKEIGFNVIFFLAGLSSIPKEVMEAAKIDGASPLQTFFRVTLPLLSPTLFFVTLVSILNSFQSFGQIHILTGGGPAGATQILVYSLYRDGFVNFRMGSASAQALILFCILMGLTLVQGRISKKRVHYG